MSEPLGSAAEEALRLLGAAQEWVRTRLDDEHLATGTPACASCPLCQAVGGLRHFGPETVEHLLDSAASLVAALRSVVAPTAGPTPAATPFVEHTVVRED